MDTGRWHKPLRESSGRPEAWDLPLHEIYLPNPLLPPASQGALPPYVLQDYVSGYQRNYRQCMDMVRLLNALRRISSVSPWQCWTNFRYKCHTCGRVLCYRYWTCHPGYVFLYVPIWNEFSYFCTRKSLAMQIYSSIQDINRYLGAFRGINQSLNNLLLVYK